MTSLASQKRIAAQVMKCGESRVRINQDKDVQEALTRQDIRNLIRKGLIWKAQKKGTSKFYSRKRLAQKKKGRRMAAGSRKGRAGVKSPKKRNWITTVRTLRKLLRELKRDGRIEGKAYSNLYLKVKGGAFRGRSHLMLYLKEHELLKAVQVSRKPWDSQKKAAASRKPNAARKKTPKKAETKK